jgi:hypothetical protein
LQNASQADNEWPGVKLHDKRYQSRSEQAPSEISRDGSNAMYSIPTSTPRLIRMQPIPVFYTCSIVASEASVVFTRHCCYGQRSHAKRPGSGCRVLNTSGLAHHQHPYCKQPSTFLVLMYAQLTRHSTFASPTALLPRL